ncbi:hypothetical protein BASA50_007028 [Batrachochytrium salamandrivorans]|uniref:non-specific serine/threonine protein kinase n=1 Tax=Batrachochytrium salamandrivorans TaxID=1357716 RepID=A0ABQ8FBJ0_9FUNG|nr:hypothetical protein BASA62_006270 [Batrachochytrium salamandrivorans]KAH6578272.1 hypothetical protein BASA60_003662 [Batrachochytrium salamandrivorans]KAH6585182.1 hypothetical protein BASA61_007047 [Batrachochytrium salamandrivorans]KAH6593973.1 hypothetical protein BASA50_007028 [Batrachochytrium salamandrivorans]KAH9270630.1 hypothetical protein BASA83_007237 [Batrachochytrium salamandrivorans]
MFDPLLWVLYHFVTHYAGQTTQGNTNDGDGVDRVSDPNLKPKKATGLSLKVYPLSLTRALQKNKTPDQKGADKPADFQPGKECKGGHGVRKVPKSCSQQPSPLELRPSTSYDPSQSDEMPLPAYFKMGILRYHTHFWKTKQYRIFTEKEGMYFRSEYSSKEKLGQGKFGAVYLATKKSNGVEVACKSIPKKNVKKYTLESSPSPICHLRNSLVGSDEQSVAQCMSSRPANLPFPYEFMLQIYLSRPGHENLYVPTTLDYFILESEFVVVMEYLGDKWMTLSSYLRKKKQIDVSEACDIIREIVKAMTSLKRYGVVHRDLHGMFQ